MEDDAGTAHADVHEVLLQTSRRLEGLRSEAIGHRDGDRASADGVWRSAAMRIDTALQALEDLAGHEDPTLGRRRWTSRSANDLRGRDR